MSAVETALRSKGSLAWAYAMMISLSATLFALQTSEVRADFTFISTQTYDFTFYGTNTINSAQNGSMTGQFITVIERENCCGNNLGYHITRVTGNASGLESVGIKNGYFDFQRNDSWFADYRYHDNYPTQIYFNLSIPVDGKTVYMDFRDGGASVNNGTTYFTSIGIPVALAAPEIDGSVVPRAAFVMIGLFWIFKSRQRRLRLAEA